MAFTPPYLKEWYYYKSISDGNVELYDYLYQCIKAGVTVDSENDGGIVTITKPTTGEEIRLYGDVDYRFMKVPTARFGKSKEKIIDVFERVCRDNPDLLAYYTTLNDEKLVDNEDGICEMGYFAMPSNTERAKATAHINSNIDTLFFDVVRKKTATKYGTGIEPNTVLSEEQKRDVFKILHDIIINIPSIKDTGDETKNYSDYFHSTIYPIFREKKFLLCMGFAQSMVYLCKFYGINCIHISGWVDHEADGHAWNYVSFTQDRGIFSTNSSDWTAADVRFDDNLKNEWWYVIGENTNEWTFFCNPDHIYHWEDKERSDRIHLNREHKETYPVAIPTASYIYKGDTLYDIAEESWEN